MRVAPPLLLLLLGAAGPALASGTPEIRTPRSQTEMFACRGSTLEHRIDYEAGGRR